MITKTEKIESSRQAQLMIVDIENTTDVIRFTLAMMKAIKNGVDFINTPTFNEVDAIANAMEEHCNIIGVSTIV